MSARESRDLPIASPDIEEREESWISSSDIEGVRDFLLPSPDLEEGADVYRPGGLHPVYKGDLCHDRYEVLSKIGFGVCSTVWLVRDRREQTEDKKFRALKVLSAGCYGQGKELYERDILKHLRD
ncbi:serine/threonine protein kinase [Diaporthe helianthi]|uniref:non-specific serine/threonine protein kinase n=1 Tax=Diaporthe helianthi TaxID=158607 RepID=A0A2P5ICI1_DIAHE|nr:serine/threonine protein kinase [Diaporthe helianthi]